jgi:hypothetical protein
MEMHRLRLHQTLHQTCFTGSGRPLSALQIGSVCRHILRRFCSTDAKQLNANLYQGTDFVRGAIQLSPNYGSSFTITRAVLFVRLNWTVPPAATVIGANQHTVEGSDLKAA